jgi:hypothetical protein
MNDIEHRNLKTGFHYICESVQFTVDPFTAMKMCRYSSYIYTSVSILGVAVVIVIVILFCSGPLLPVQ